MTGVLPIPELLDSWLVWATEQKCGGDTSELTGWMEFNWAVEEAPEQAWAAILAALQDSRMDPHLGALAAGPLEDLLALHGPQFIARVEDAARSDPKFAHLLGGVWRFTMSDDVWARVQLAWDRSGWNG